MFSTPNLYLNRFTAPDIYKILCRDNPNYCTQTHKWLQYNVWCTQGAESWESARRYTNEKMKAEKYREAGKESERHCPFKLKWGQRSEYRGTLMMTLETWSQTQLLSSALRSLVTRLSSHFLWECVSTHKLKLYAPLDLFFYCGITAHVQNVFSFIHLLHCKYLLYSRVKSFCSSMRCDVHFNVQSVGLSLLVPG